MKLVDTSVVVDIDRGAVDERVARLDEEGRHAVSAVTLAEVELGVDKRYGPHTGVRDDALEHLERLVARFDVLPIDRTAVAVAADIIDELARRGEPLNDLHDVYIGAAARTERLPVLTANVDHFERIGDVRAVDLAGY